MVNAPVFQAVDSPPSPACLTTNEVTRWLEPRSTCRILVPLAVEQYLLVLPSLPSNAFSGPSEELQDAEPDALFPAARFVPSSGAAAGGVQPSLKGGGTFAGSVPQEEALPPIVYEMVAPFARSP